MLVVVAVDVHLLTRKTDQNHDGTVWRDAWSPPVLTGLKGAGRFSVRLPLGVEGGSGHRRQKGTGGQGNQGKKEGRSVLLHLDAVDSQQTSGLRLGKKAESRGSLQEQESCGGGDSSTGAHPPRRTARRTVPYRKASWSGESSPGA